MKINLLITLTLMFTLNIAYSQVKANPVNKLNPAKEVSLEEKLEGTYQIISNDNKIVEVFSIDLLKIIEAKREDNRDVTYQASQNTSVIIFSREKINSKEFKNKKNNN